MIGTFDIKKLNAARKRTTVNLLCLWLFMSITLAVRKIHKSEAYLGP